MAALAKASTIVYRIDKIIISSPLEKDFAGTMIKNKEIHNSYKDTFETLWNVSSVP